MPRSDDPLYGDLSDEDNAALRRDETIADTFSLGFADMGGRRARSAAANLMLDLQGPQYSDERLVAPEYSGDFTPQMYSDPLDATATMADESPEGRAAMMQALEDIRSGTSQAVGSQRDLDRLRATQDAAQFSQGREGLIRQDAMRRGQLGGAADMVSRQVAAQGAANRNQGAGLQSAQMAALQELAGARAAGDLGGAIRGGDQALAFRNQDAINQFNLGNTAQRNAMRMANTQLANTAGLRNLDARQQMLGARAAATNANIGRADANAQGTADFAARRAAGAGNALNGLAAGTEANAAAARDTAGDALNWLARLYGGGSGGK